MGGYLGSLMWLFLPSQVTHLVLPTLCSLAPGLLPPAPQGTPGYLRNYRLVITTIVMGWLAYQFVTDGPGDRFGGDWYQLLGVGPRATDAELKKAFRTLSRKYHPDILGPAAGPETEGRFIMIRLAYEALTDPVKRFAYDRFGPDIARWQGIETTRDYVRSGAASSLSFYVVSIGMLLVLGLLGRAREGAFWRNVLMGVLLVVEATLVLSPTPAPGAPLSSAPLLYPFPTAVSRVLARIIPRFVLERPAYQLIALFHRLAADAGIAISQLAGVWQTPKPEGPNGTDAILYYAANILHETTDTLVDTVAPVFGGSAGAAEQNLLDRMEQAWVDKGMQVHPAVGAKWDEVVEREMRKSGRGGPRPPRIAVSGPESPVHGHSPSSAKTKTKAKNKPRFNTGLRGAPFAAPFLPPSPGIPSFPGDPGFPGTPGFGTPYPPSPSPRAFSFFPDVPASPGDEKDIYTLAQSMPLPPSPPGTPAPDASGKAATPRRSARLTRA